MSDPAQALPEGLTTRPLDKTESRALFDLIAAQERHDTGSVEIEEADLVSDWALPGYDLESSSIGVYDGEQLVATPSTCGATASTLPSTRTTAVAASAPGWRPGSVSTRLPGEPR